MIVSSKSSSASSSAARIVALAAALVLVGGTAAVAADAVALWDKNCASCHGKDGKAKTKMGEKLKCRDLTDPAVKAKVDKTAVMNSMKNGVKDEAGKVVMKAYTEKLSEEEMQVLTDYTLGLK